MKAVAVDVHYNAGLGSNPSFVKSLKDGDYPAALKNTLDIVGVTKDGTQYTSSGLAKRRASIYNVGAAGLGLPLITDTLTTKKDGGSKSQVSYFVGDGKDVLLSLNLNKPLATDSTEGWKNPVDYGFKADNVVSADRLTPQQMEKAVKPNSSILDKIKRGIESVIPSAQAAEYEFNPERDPNSQMYSLNPEADPLYKYSRPSSASAIGMLGNLYTDKVRSDRLDAMGEVVSPPLAEIPQRYSFEEQQAMSDLMSGVGADYTPTPIRGTIPKIAYNVSSNDSPPKVNYQVTPSKENYMTMEDLLMDRGLMKNPLLLDDADAERMWRQF